MKRGNITVECDTATCHAEQVWSADALWAAGESLPVIAHEAGWRVDWDNCFTCPECIEEGK
jgi:hypothetical protein